MQNLISLSSADLLIEPLEAKYLKAALQLEDEAGLSTSAEAQMLRRLQYPETVLLSAVRQSDNVSVVGLPLIKEAREIVGLFSGWVVTDELEIDNLVVAKAQRRRGIGKALLFEGMRIARQKGAKNAYLEVRENNLAALRLYFSFGFVMIGRRKDYYHDPFEDALRLGFDLNASLISMKEMSLIRS